MNCVPFSRARPSLGPSRSGSHFSALSARQQQALALKYTEGASLEAIARALDSTPGAVGSLLHRARAAFRQAYDRLRSRGSA